MKGLRLRAITARAWCACVTTPCASVGARFLTHRPEGDAASPGAPGAYRKLAGPSRHVITVIGFHESLEQPRPAAKGGVGRERPCHGASRPDPEPGKKTAARKETLDALADGRAGGSPLCAAARGSGRAGPARTTSLARRARVHQPGFPLHLGERLSRRLFARQLRVLRSGVERHATRHRPADPWTTDLLPEAGTPRRLPGHARLVLSRLPLAGLARNPRRSGEATLRALQRHQRRRCRSNRGPASAIRLSRAEPRLPAGADRR